MFKKITIGEFLDAMEKNGYKKTRYTYFQYARHENGTRDRSNIVAACAFGQAAKNLGVKASSLNGVLGFMHGPITSRVIGLNDNSNLSVPNIAKKVRKEFPDMLDMTFEVEV